MSGDRSGRPPPEELAAWTDRWRQQLSVGTDAVLAPGGAAGLARRVARHTVTGLTSQAQAEAAGAAIGRELAAARLTSPAMIRRVVELLGDGTSTTPTTGGAPAALQGAAVAALAAALQDALLEQQEAIHQAALTALGQAERASRDSQARFRAVFSEAAIGIGIGDIQGTILDANASLQRMLGYTLPELRACRVEDFVHPDDAADIWEGYAALVAGDLETFRAEKRYRHRDGHDIWTDLTVSLIRNEEGEPAFQVAMMEDVTGRHELQERLVRAATRDPLTGLANRALFLRQMDDALADPDPHTRVGVCFLDLDSFKMVNDTWGHVVGDRVLVEAAGRLTRVADSNGARIARLAGDEFVVLTTARHGAVVDHARLGADLLAALEAPFDVGAGEPLTVRASVGVVDLPAGAAGAGELLRAADLALHSAKEEGKGRVVVHDPTRTARQITRFGIAMSLPGVVERGELALVYQPLVRLSSGRLHGVEALLRWRHPRLGELDPEVFIAIAEEGSAIIPIGQWVLEQACRDLATHGWPAVSINVSVRQLHSPGFVQEVQRCLDQASLPARSLRIEVTESVIMDTKHPAPLATLDALAHLGVGIVMDDFGTGYSNLATLRWLPLQELKLAGTFVDGLREPVPDPVDLKMLTSLVDLAHFMGVLVTAEDIETATQAGHIRAIGCDVGQGRYYGAPGGAALASPPAGHLPEPGGAPHSETVPRGLTTP